MPTELVLFVIDGKRKPVDTGRTLDRTKPFPTTLKHEGTTYHFSNADFVERTVTYVNVPLTFGAHREGTSK